ncbi:VOC family protein [Marinobacterium rhizophilum]|uniref:SMU1112c/YaeR family gloxylase I-like metalloprotein n=1 Tax=Marinobacterium rhizophilum TaxID=420402 RepID=UPI000367F043
MKENNGPGRPPVKGADGLAPSTENGPRPLSEEVRPTTALLRGIHHVAIICADYPRSRAFYVDVLGLEVIAENYRAQRASYKLDLRLPSGAQIELFSFPEPPARPSTPEAQGLRHLAFAVDDMVSAVAYLESCGVAVEPVRVDEFTGQRFTFFNDPDGLPLELYEVRQEPDLVDTQRNNQA